MRKHSWKSHLLGVMRCARRKCGVMTRNKPGTRTVNEYKKPGLTWSRTRPPCTGESTAN